MEEPTAELAVVLGFNRSDSSLPKLANRPPDEVAEAAEVDVTSLAETVVGLAAAVVAARVLDCADPVTVMISPLGSM